ncbi:MAG: hypothetical protein KA392_08375 [Candidatus Obscuribacter sp.]|nr:hypothetical protein [Candidatus Obscuribacter sp.]
MSLFLRKVAFTTKSLALLLGLAVAADIVIATDMVIAAPVPATAPAPAANLSSSATKAPFASTTKSPVASTNKAKAKSVRRIAKVHRTRRTRTAALKPLVPSLDTSVPATQATTASGEVRNLLTYGARKHKEGSLTEAEDCFRRVLSQDPQNVDAFFNLGALAEGRGDLIVALGHYRAAHALNPKDKQITEAVSSMEKALKDGGSGSDTRITRSGFSLTPPFALPHPLPVGGTIASPVDFTNTGFGGSLSAFPQRPQGQNLLTPSGYSASAAAPVLLPSADPAPVSQDGQLFQLTGTQNAAMPPVVPVQQNNQTPPSLTVGNSQSGVAPTGPSRGRMAARAAANMALSIGTSYALRGTGLHCPICRIVRLRF